MTVINCSEINNDRFHNTFISKDGKVYTEYRTPNKQVTINVNGNNKEVYPKKLEPTNNNSQHHYMRLKQGKRRQVVHEVMVEVFWENWKNYMTSQPVWKSYWGNKDNEHCVHHIDRNPENNHLDNLLPMTQADHRSLHDNLSDDNEGNMILTIHNDPDSMNKLDKYLDFLSLYTIK